MIFKNKKIITYILLGLLFIITPLKDLRSDNGYRKKVLFISSYNSSFPTFFDQIKGLKNILDKENIIIDLEFMDSKRFNNKENISNFHRTLRSKLSKLPPYNAVITSDDNALNYVLKNRKILKGSPIVFFGLNDERLASRLDKDCRCTGIVESISDWSTLNFISDTFPERKHLFLITDSTVSAQKDQERVIRTLSNLNRYEYEILSLADHTLVDMTDYIRMKKSESVILIISASIDSSGKPLDFNTTVKFISTKSSVPIFHLWEHGIGSGIMGGKVVSHMNAASLAAKIVLKIINGADISKMKILTGDDANIFRFDYRELSKFKINTKVLPEDSEIINLPVSFYTKNRKKIFIALIIFISQAVLILLLVVQLNYRKKVQGKLKAAKEKAESANQYKNIFLANISHELRTPLNGISGIIDILDSERLDNEQKGLVKLIKESSDMLTNIISDILDISKIENGLVKIKNIKFNLKESAVNLIKIMKISYSRNDIEIKYSISDNADSDVSGDPDRLRQVLINLVGNGIKFTKEGSVSLHIFRLEDTNSNNNVFFRISDTGIGIEDQDRNKIFEKFNQGSRSTSAIYGGTGLGLAIARDLVEKMGGEIHLEKTAPGSTSFLFYIPLYAASEKTEKKMTAVRDIEIKQKKIQSKLRILIAEDNVINQKVAQKLLYKMGHETDIAKNGIEALEKTRSSQYDLILMDCQMPEMDGFEATSKIRNDGNYNSSKPIIALTAYSMENEIKKCFDSGMNDVLIKPVTLNKLHESISQFTEE